MSAPVILVLEDFEQARFVIRLVLEGGGYNVFEAATEAQALDLCREPEQRLDLLISDVVLREACGTEVAVRISALRPRLPILFMSGYPIEDIPSFSLLASHQTAAIQFLQKPFDPERLLGKVRELVPTVRKANA